MDRSLLPITAILLAVSSTIARPDQLKSQELLKDNQYEYKASDLKPEPSAFAGISREYTNLLDADQWKELLAQGKVREMIDAIQRALGSDQPVRMRTQWGGGPDSKDALNTVQNTIKWNPYEGEKSNLNVVMDSKFARKNGKVDMINPSVGLNFQLKY